MGPKTNLELLTEGEKYIQKARKARREQVESIKFDDEARREWLSGFSKRKKAKFEDKRARAKERDHQAHLEQRRQARQELKRRAAENVRNARIAMGLEPLDKADGESDDDPGGVEQPEVSRPLQDEYEDEDQIATVTIVEDFDPNQAGPSTSTSPSPDRQVVGPDGSDLKKGKKRLVPDMPASSRRAEQKAKRFKVDKGEKDKGRSMETKAERKMGRTMEAKRRSKKAHIALERDGRRRGLSTVKGKAKGNSKVKGKRK